MNKGERGCVPMSYHRGGTGTGRQGNACQLLKTLSSSNGRLFENFLMEAEKQNKIKTNPNKQQHQSTNKQNKKAIKKSDYVKF